MGWAEGGCCKEEGKQRLRVILGVRLGRARAPQGALAVAKEAASVKTARENPLTAGSHYSGGEAPSSSHSCD